MNEIKPIETYYNGYRFRSRLEARWAVFFDYAKIPYQYEPEGFNLGPLGYYLPDFYLPWFDAFVEIKPTYSNQIKSAVEKLETLFEQTTHTVLLCIGDPADNDIRIYCNDLTDGSGGGPNEWPACFLESPGNSCWCTTKHTILLAIGYKNDRDRNFYNAEWGEIKSSCRLIDVKYFRNDFSHAKTLSRQARFEYGETPKGGNE